MKDQEIIEQLIKYGFKKEEGKNSTWCKESTYPLSKGIFVRVWVINSMISIDLCSSESNMDIACRYYIHNEGQLDFLLFNSSRLSICREGVALTHPLHPA